MHETIVRVLEHSSIIIEKEKWSSEKHLNYNNIISHFLAQIFFNDSQKLEIHDKIGTIVCFYRKCYF